MDENICLTCSNKVDHDSFYCEKCTNDKRAQNKYCSNCGKKWNTCNYCEMRVIGCSNKDCKRYQGEYESVYCYPCI